MQKGSPVNDKIQTSGLLRYLKAQFSQYHLPPIQEFLNIKKSSSTEVKAFTFSADPHAQLPVETAQLLEGEAIYYLQSGVIELHKKEGRQWKREIEYKEGNFFTLINYKSLAHAEPQWYKLVLKTKVAISVLPIRPAYNFEWMKGVWLKNNILSKIFFYGDPEMEIERKRLRFHEFCSNFKHEVFRRDTKIIQEGNKNYNLYIIAKGEAKLLKNLSVNNKGKGHIEKKVEIIYLREGAVLAAELFLISSKSIHSIINNHSQTHAQSQLSLAEEHESDGEDALAQRQKRRSKSRFSKIAVESGGYQLYHPHQNVSNFTVIAESASLQLFIIELDSLVKLINERHKINFLKMLESTYITLLRRTHEKMLLQLKKEQERISKNNNKIQTIAAKAYSTNGNQTQITSTQHQAITMKVSEIGMAGSVISQFKLEGVRKAQNNKIDRRTDLLVREKKPDVDFKERIQALIEKKLNKAANEQTLPQQIVEDLADIFMKSNQGRSQDIQRRAELLQKKRMILERRGGWKPGWDQLMTQGVKIQVKKQPLVVPNYLTGVDTELLAEKMKVECNHRIHETNKIKQQFMKIKSECPSCSCYDNFENFSTGRRSMTSLGRTGYKTAQGWGRTSKVRMEEQSLESVYHKMAFLSQKAKEKYSHNIHLLQVRRNRSQLERRKSAPKFY